METGVVIISTTIPSEELALELARALVEAHLAACVQVSPVKSVYRWESSLHVDAEHLLSAKTAAACADKLIAFIKERHPYELPEILQVPVSGGYPAYFEWVKGETSDAAK
jgi:periplasmic divalent cation tolerance protein